MASPALVLVHGAQHAADCWEPTIDEIHRRAPELTVLAVDLPGRRNTPGDLFTATIDGWAESVVSDIVRAGLDDVIIVGHSMAGLTVPFAVNKLGAPRVREVVFAAAFVPSEGSAFVDTFPGLLGVYARLASRRAVRRRKAAALPKMWAAYTFCNGMTRQQREFNMNRLCVESPSVPIEPVDRSGMPDEIPRTWILTLRDRTISPKAQRKCIEALGGVQALIEMDTCHNLMVSEPERLAEILVARCRRYR